MTAWGWMVLGVVIGASVAALTVCVVLAVYLGRMFDRF